MENYVNAVARLIADAMIDNSGINKSLASHFVRSNNYRVDLAFLVGNGLTRTAYDCAMRYRHKDNMQPRMHYKEVALSWNRLIGDLLESSGIAADYEYLLYLGYTNSEIVQIALESIKQNNNPKGSQTFVNFCKRLDAIPYLPAHAAMLKNSNIILTTNYDRLFSNASKDQKYNHNTYSSITSFFNSNKSCIEDKSIIHLHGAYHENGCDIDFKSCDESGLLKRVVLTKSQYAEASLKHIAWLGSQLSDHIIIAIGFGFAVDEIIISKLLEMRRAPSIFVEVTTELDPQLKYRIRGAKGEIISIALPMGLCASPWRRSLIPLALLDVLKFVSAESQKRRHINYANPHVALTGLEAGLNALRNTIGNDINLKTTPSVAIIGPVAWNTIIGIEEWIGQEQFLCPVYGPLTSEQTNDDTKRFCSEIGGQAGVPAMTLDALGVGSSLISAVSSDDTGRKIVERLGETDWINFSGLTQGTKFNISLTQNHLPLIGSTNNVTAMIWEDIRSGTNTLSGGEQEDSIKKSLNRFIIADNASIRYDMSALDNVKIVYICGMTASIFLDWWKAIRPKMSPGNLPLFVIDTGSSGNNIDTQMFVSENNGVVIASALAVLRRWRPEQLKGEYRAVSDLNDSHDVNTLVTAGKRWFENIWMKTLNPKDERGRSRQLRILLELMNDCPELINKLLPPQGGSFIITLGEFGSFGIWADEKTVRLAWVINKEMEAMLTQYQKIANNKIALDEFFNRNDNKTYNALSTYGCGDVFRSAFCASLLYVDASKELKISNSESLFCAMLCANIIAHVKSRFFRAEDFWSWVKVYQPTIADEFIQIRKDAQPIIQNKSYSSSILGLIEKNTCNFIISTFNYKKDSLSHKNNDDFRRYVNPLISFLKKRETARHIS